MALFRKREPPGEEGATWQEQPDRVQGAQPDIGRPMRDSHHVIGTIYRDPGNMVEAMIGDAKRNREPPYWEEADRPHFSLARDSAPELSKIEERGDLPVSVEPHPPLSVGRHR